VLWDIDTDPELAGTKLIAEAWDAAGLYQVGSFLGDSWREWNGKFRDDVRSFFRGDKGTVAPLADRLVGSPQIYGHKEREAEQSVNFVTSHDGFTLNDLVSYSQKHNASNGEDNRDGTDDNRSWNCGVEGQTDDPAIEKFRNRQVKNFLSVTMLSLGLPMILMSDEVRRTQLGNNNAYCQDNEIGWVGWEGLNREGDDLTDFIGHMTGLRQRFAQIRSQRWLDGRRADGSYGVLWLTPSADEMTEQDWNFPEGRFLAYVLGPTEEGQAPIFIVLNAAPEAIALNLPKMPEYKNWEQVLNTADSEQISVSFVSGADVEAPPRSVLAYAGSA
jgi:isoamylase